MIRQQVKALYKGPKQFRNEAFPVIQEYLHRKTLSKIGYRDSLGKMPWVKAGRFQVIANEIELLKADEMKKSAPKRKGK